MKMLFKKPSKADRFLVVGLGNPGLQYEKTRHNAGFMVADVLAENLSLEFTKRKFDSHFGEAEYKSYRIIVAKPQTFMNLSGKAVVALSNFYKIPKEKIIIVSDDINLPVGNIRIRRKGSAGGHNGLKDIIELMGSEEIPRIKVGVGERKNMESDLKDHVLGKIPKEQESDFSAAVSNAAKAVLHIIDNGIDSAMNKYSK